MNIIFIFFMELIKLNMKLVIMAEAIIAKEKKIHFLKI